MTVDSTNSAPNVFPYGTVLVDAVIRERYTQDYEWAQSYPLPEQLPAHHPLLQRLEQTVPVAYTIPPWWRARVAEIATPWLRQMLADVTAQEFREGTISHVRWKAFRKTLSSEERRGTPTSSKIVGLLEAEGVGWSGNFTDRGPVKTPDRCQLVISTHPLDFLSMSDGRAWSSCLQRKNGKENQRLPGNFYDPTVAVAMLLPEGNQVRDNACVLARTTLRIFRGPDQAVIGLGRTYHNNETLALLLLSSLAEILDTNRLSWGVITGNNTHHYVQDGFLGSALCGRLANTIEATSERWLLPHNWETPSVDGGANFWERDWDWEHEVYYATHLHAQLHLVHLPCAPHAPIYPHLASAPLLCRGMLPQLPSCERRRFDELFPLYS